MAGIEDEIQRRLEIAEREQQPLLSILRDLLRGARGPVPVPSPGAVGALLAPDPGPLPPVAPPAWAAKKPGQPAMNATIGPLTPQARHNELMRSAGTLQPYDPIGSRELKPAEQELLPYATPTVPQLTQRLWDSPLGMVLDPADAAAMAVGKAVGKNVGKALGKEVAKRQTSIAEAAKVLFPRVDSYGKPVAHMSSATMLKRIEAAENLAPKTKTALTTLAGQIGDRRVAPAEIHALAAGQTYTPARVLREPRVLKEGEKQIVGAPLGVANAKDARALRENYIKGMEKGATGREWYHDTGRDILFAANDNPERARLLAGDMSITSPTSSVGANAGFGVKGYNQATAGVPVVAGRYPTAMGKSIETLHAGGEGSLGLKRDPFAQNIALGGGFHQEIVPLSEGVELIIPAKKTRAVHDIWDAELHGFVNPDGTPMRTGFGPAQHRFMDTQQDKLLATANQRAVAGHTDWDELRSQAAGWTGAKIDAGTVDPKDAAKHFGDYFESLLAQGSRETIPGRRTGHMPEMLKKGQAEGRELYHELVKRESGIYDQQMRDQIAAGYGGLVGRAFEGPGVYKREISPGMQTQVLTGSVEVPHGSGRRGAGARVLDEGSRRILDATEATHGLLLGQDASAYSRILPAGSGAPRNGWDVTLPGGKVTHEQMQTVVSMLGSDASRMALIPTPDGIRLGLMDEATAKRVIKQLGGKVKTAGSFQGNLMTNNWLKQPQGQRYWEAIRKMGTEKFDQFAPAMAGRLRAIDQRFAKMTGGRFTLSPAMDEVRAAIANEGFVGLERLSKKYGIPAIALAAALAELQQQEPTTSESS